MKRILILFLALLSVASFAAVHRYPNTRHRVSTTRKTLYSVPWKTIAAGGAAAGTIITAYKVSDGIEEGIKTVAKEKPEIIPATLGVITWPVRWAFLILFFLSGCWITKKWLEFKSASTTKGHRKWKSN